MPDVRNAKGVEKDLEFCSMGRYQFGLVRGIDLSDDGCPCGDPIRRMEGPTASLVLLFFSTAGSWAGNASNGVDLEYNVGAKTLRRAKERTSLPSLASRSTPTYSSFFFALFPFSFFVHPHYRRRTKIQFRNTPLCIRSAAAPSLTALGSAANRIQSEMLVL
jgi:hypothetical protein